MNKIRKKAKKQSEDLFETLRKLRDCGGAMFLVCDDIQNRLMVFEELLKVE